jgi:anti-sigma factor RsiW
MHIAEGQLKAYLDHELGSPERERIREHLATCPSCQQQLESLSTQAEQVASRLAILAARPVEGSPPVGSVRDRLQKRILEKEKMSMFQKIFSRQYRLAWAALGLVLVLAVAMAFPPVQAIANSFLGLFRVQHITVVPVNSTDFQQLGSSQLFESMLSKDANFEQVGEKQTVASAAEASSLAGIPVRLPDQMDGTQEITVQPGEHATLKIDLPTVKALLQEIGQGNIDLPANLDGATVTLDLPQPVVANYGNCTPEPEATREAGSDPDMASMAVQTDCTTLIQLASPTISAPPGLDLTQLGQAYLQLTGMTPDEAAKFSQTVDWTTTLVVPMPRYRGVSYETVNVDGVNGTMIQQDYNNSSGSGTMTSLLWVKGGIVYFLHSPGDSSNALAIANSLK